MIKNYDIFSDKNITLLGSKMVVLEDGIKSYYDFPYDNYKDIQNFVKTLNPKKNTTNEDIDKNFEENAVTYPISLTFDWCIKEYGRIPTCEELVNMYIELSLEKNPDGTYTEKKCYGSTFKVTRKAVESRIYKAYFSFIREIMTYVYLRNNLSRYGAIVFINRRDDYKERMDIGIKYNNILYIIDTSVKTERSDNFEERKINGTRRNLKESEEFLIKKYNCIGCCRILAKANMKYGGNTYNCGQLKMYKDNFLNSICTYILNNNKYGVSINADDLLTTY